MLPYQSLEEAEASLGRALSVAEQLWFKYTAHKPDYVIFNYTLLLAMLFYTLSSLPFVLIELGWFNNTAKYKIQPKRKPSFSTMFKCFKDVMRDYVFYIGPIGVFSYPIMKWAGIRTGLPLPSLSELFWQILVYAIVEDYCNYWIHRWLHTKWAFQKIHRIHHEYTSPFGLTAPYAHWAETMILGLPTFMVPALIPGHVITNWTWFLVRQWEAMEIHSGYDFPWNPTKYIPFYGGAEFHDYHHFVGERTQSNFASFFTYCDYIYGTDKGYRYHKQALEKSKTKLGTHDLKTE